MQNKEGQKILMIKLELMTLQEYLQTAAKLINGEDLGFTPDYEEIKMALTTCDERFAIIDELLLQLEEDLAMLKGMINHE